MNLKKILGGVAFVALLFLQSCRETDVVELPQEGNNKELMNKIPKQDSIVIPPTLPEPKDPKDPPGK